MTGLLIKDWKLFKNQGRYFFTILIVALAILFVGSKDYSMFASSYITWLVAYFTLSTISYDEYDNGMGFLMTLPISRQIYVAEKYILSLLLTGSAWLFSLGLNAILLYRNATPEEWIEMILTDLIFLLIILVFISISLPLFLKYGPEKGRMISLGVVGAVILAFFLIGKLGIDISKLNVLDTMSIQQPLVLFGICAIICVLFMIISYLISVKLMEHREF